MVPVLAVSVVEDDSPTRDALQVLLSGTPGVRFVSAHASCGDAVENLPIQRVDVALVDIGLPRTSGIECVRQLKRLKPNLHVIMFTVHEDNEKLFESLVAGANGYIVKRTPPAAIVAAIRDVAAGGAPMTPSIARRVLQHFHSDRHPVAEVEELTLREGEILHQLSIGHTSKEIASTLGISPETVRNHLKNIYAKLHVHTRTEAAAKYLGAKQAGKTFTGANLSPQSSTANRCIVTIAFRSGSNQMSQQASSFRAE